MKTPTRHQKVAIAAVVVVALTAAIAYGWLGAEPALPTVVPVAAAADNAPAASTPPAVPAAAPGVVVASFGNIKIMGDEAETLLQALPAQARAQLQNNRPVLEQWLRSVLAERAVLQQAEARGWRDRPEVRDRVEAAARQIVLRSYLESVAQVPAGYPSESELAAAYETAKSNFAIPPSYRISQIFVAAPLNDDKAIDAARKQAEDIAKRAKAKGADFAALAKQHSQDKTTAARGGDTGLVPLPQLLPEMRPVVADMKKGEVSGPVQSAAGFHVLQLTDVQPARTASLSDVRPQLTEALRKQRREQVAKAYLDGVLNGGTVTIDGASLTAALERVR